MVVEVVTVGNFLLALDKTMPRDEIHFVQRDDLTGVFKRVAVITGLKV
jgi:hypothetical protein